MNQTPFFQDPAYLKESQYKSSQNLDARANLHRLFSTAPTPWQTWVFDQLGLQPGFAVLECGGGPGWLWRENVTRIPEGCRITFTDFSPGMVAEAEAALADTGHDFRFQTADIQELPFAGSSFDVVVANHMLYHVPDLAQGLRQVRRVLRPDGRFVCATNGERHMQELWQLAADMIDILALPVPPDVPNSHQWTPNFRLENGAEKLSAAFNAIERRLFEDSLEVTAAAPLLAYITSSFRLADVTPETAAQMLRYLEQKIKSAGSIHITKETGLFVAR